jgi:hypothetical protein
MAMAKLRRCQERPRGQNGAFEWRWRIREKVSWATSRNSVNDYLNISATDNSP